MSIALATSAPADNFPQAISELKSAVTVASDGIENTLERARDLVRDATAHLLTSFSALQKVLEDQNGMLKEVSETLGRAGVASFAAAAGRMVNEFVDEIVRVSHESMRIIEQLVDTSEHFNAIVSHAERIDHLARETRFIALNARIETQRAGEAGKTFKVVADEVKRLAGASAEISTHIRTEVDLCFQSLQHTRRGAEGLAGRDMSVVLDSRAALVTTVERLDTVNRAVEDALGRVTSAIGEAIRALQFEDMVTQLLAEAGRRVRTFGALLLDAVVLVEQRREEGPARLAIVTRSLLELGEVGSISQQDLEQGSVELF